MAQIAPLWVGQHAESTVTDGAIAMLVALQVQTDRVPLHQAGAALAGALVERGHEIGIVYFHDAGVRVVDPVIAVLWSSLVSDDARLLVCSTGLASRGLQSDLMPAGFQSAGLGQAFDQMLGAHRCITIR